MKTVEIFGGGTFAHIKSHLALAAPAFGSLAKEIYSLCAGRTECENMHINLHLTKMADPNSHVVTNEDVAARLTEVIRNSQTKIVFFTAALCDFYPREATFTTEDGHCFTSDFGKHAGRFSSDSEIAIVMSSTQKLVGSIRRDRKDIFLVACKTTCGATRQEMYLKGLKLLKEASANLVLVNDVKERYNMIVTPEEAVYHETRFRNEAVKNLVDMALRRSQLTFTQSTVIAGDPVAWGSNLVPPSLRAVVDYCVAKNAYKPFKDATVGHFAHKLDDQTFLTSIRKSNFNELYKNGLVLVKTDGPDTVLAYGAKPSVGGQSQRIVFKDHPGFDCIVHFHCPLKAEPRDIIPVRSQRDVECGSHECGKNTSDGLGTFRLAPDVFIKCVMLDNHGPNIVFPKDIHPSYVIDFIEANFDLEKKTGGYQL